MRPAPEVQRALDLLEKQDVLFSIHGPSFPFSEGEDLGVGTPCSEAARRLLERVRREGYTGVLLGPEGQTSPANPSPYDSTWFSKSRLLASPGEWVRRGWVHADELSRVVDHGDAVDRADYVRAHRRVTFLLDCAWARRDPDDASFRAFVEANRTWLEADGLHAICSARHQGAPHAEWPAADGEASPFGPAIERERWATLLRVHARRLERYAFEQWLIHEQRAAFRSWAHSVGLAVWGDLQIGHSDADAWRFRRLFLPKHRLGAPPSRTNPEGQPWGYGVPDPDRASRVFEELWQPRVARFAADYDGMRIDHPHGWVCPWVYRCDTDDPHAAVRAGARLFESPEEPDHPELARHARVRPDQLSKRAGLPRHADDWVRSLEPHQVDAYAETLERLTAPFRHRPDARVAMEVLSTQPRPLARVTERLGLGRFRVTQKADLRDERDVYRSDLAAPEDWVMVGTHDTESIWSLASGWVGRARGRSEARFLAARLGSTPEDEARLASDASALVHAKLADVFASPARHVIVFFADHLGCSGRYNLPGTVGPHNWTLRAPGSAEGGLDLRRVLGWALRMRFQNPSDEVRGLVARLVPEGYPGDASPPFAREPHPRLARSGERA